MSTLENMRSRYNSGFSTLDRAYLDKLHYELFGKGISNKGCSDCYRDAFILSVTYLNKYKAMPQKSIYRLKPGAVIQFFGKSTVYTNPNLTDEVAERYLALNSENKRMFSDLPSDWETRVAARKSGVSESNGNTVDSDVLSALTDKLTITENELAESQKANKELSEENKLLKAQLVERGESRDQEGDSDSIQEIANLTLELETLRAEYETRGTELETLKDEVSKLKNENRALKSANTRLKNSEGKDTPAAE